MPKRSNRHRMVSMPKESCVTELKLMFKKLIDGFEKHSVTASEQDKFVIAFKDAFAVINSKNDFNEVMDIYHVASRFVPTLHIHAGALFYRLGLVEEAIACFRCGVDAVPDDLSAISQLENACCALVERWHFSMLNDKSRNTAYRDAIASAISLGHRDVLDIGTGTGLLACFSARSGANNPVYACDDSPTMCALASAVFSRNSVSNVKLLKVRSNEIKITEDLPQRVSLVVTEIFDAALFGEFVLKTLQHAWRELLLPPKPEDAQRSSKDSPYGMVIPAKASVFACAVESRAIRFENRLVGGGVYRHLTTPGGTSFKGNCCTNYYEQNSATPCDDESDSDNSIPDDGLFESYTTERLCSLRDGFVQLSVEELLLTVNFNDPSQIDSLIDGVFNVNFDLRVTAAGILDAIAVWFDLDLGNEKFKRTVSTRPDATKSCWEQAVFPVHLFQENPGQSMFVEVGDVLKLKATLEDEGSRLHVRCLNVIRKAKEAESPSAEAKPVTMVKSLDTVPFQLTMSRSTLRYLNDIEYNFSFCRLLECASRVDGCQSVLIISSVPSLLAIQAASIGYQQIVQLVPHTADAMSLSNFASKLRESTLTAAATAAGASKIALPSFVVGPVEQLIGQAGVGANFDVVISELVEPCGSLRQQSVEELQLAKLMLANNCGRSPSIVCPSRLRVYGMFIESDDLFDQSAVVKGNNEGTDCNLTCRCSRTCQVHVADFINLYRVRSHINIDLHALKHRQLSEKLLLFDIDLGEEKDRKCSYNDVSNQPAWLKSVAERHVNIIATGRLAALVYWFEVDLVDGFTAQRYFNSSNNNGVKNNSNVVNIDNSVFTISTCRASSHFRQSAIMIAEDRPLSVISGYILSTRFVFHNSCLTFSFLNGTTRSNTASTLGH